MHVCMYVRTYVCMCVRMQRVYVSVCLSVCLSVFVCVRACACRGRGLPVYGYTFCMFIQKTDLFAEFTEEEGEYTCSRKEEFATERERDREREAETQREREKVVHQYKTNNGEILWTMRSATNPRFLSTIPC